MKRPRERLKALLFDALRGALYVFEALGSGIRRLTKGNVRRLGFVTFEFYHDELNGYGGYGRSVKNATDYLNRNAQGGRLAAEVLITKSWDGSRLQAWYHNAPVIYGFKERGSFFKNVCAFSRYLYGLQRRHLDCLMTIEYYACYERFLKLLPRLPVLVWIHDPRTQEDWNRIATLSLDADGAKSSAARDVGALRASLQRLLDQSRTLKREVVFLHQAECLVPKARTLYDMPSIESAFLPNPIGIPARHIQKSEEPTVCFLGRLDPIKRPWIFFELAKRFPHVKFLVAGKTHCPDIMGSITARYEQLPNLQFLGLVDGDEKDHLLQSSWLMVNTSIHEAMPVSFLEAFAARTPVISCQNPDRLTERFGLYTGEVRGDVLDEQSLEPFVSALKTMLERPDERQQKGSAARSYVESVHTFGAFERQLCAIMKDSLGY